MKLIKWLNENAEDMLGPARALHYMVVMMIVALILSLSFGMQMFMALRGAIMFAVVTLFLADAAEVVVRLGMGLFTKEDAQDEVHQPAPGVGQEHRPTQH